MPIEPSIVKESWGQARKTVMKVNPELVQEIDAMDPPNDFYVYRVRYPYGAEITNGNNRLNLPNNKGGYINIDDPNINSQLFKDLNYVMDMPMGVVTHNSIELHAYVKDIIIPYRPMPPGRIFGLWEILGEKKATDTGRVFQMISGSRFLMMFPKATAAGGLKKLKKVTGMKESIVQRSVTDQFYLLKALFDAPGCDVDWFSEVVLFPKFWVDKLEDKSWSLLELFLFRYAWEDTAFLREQVVVDFAFSMGQREKNLKPDPYLADIAKYLYRIGIGVSAGFVVANDDLCGPVKYFQNVFESIFGLDYMPNMLHTAFMEGDYQDRIFYYFLKLPMLLSFSPKSNNLPNRLEDIRQIRHIQNKIAEYIKEDHLKIGHTQLYKALNNLNFKYFHSNPDVYSEIENSLEIVKQDPILVEQNKKFQKPFCHSTPLLKGCISISKSDKM